MDIYTQAVTDDKRRAHSRVLEMVMAEGGQLKPAVN
jgi:hypothetical protein